MDFIFVKKNKKWGEVFYQSINPLFKKLLNQLHNQLINQAICKQSLNQSYYQSINLTVNKPLNQSSSSIAHENRWSIQGLHQDWWY